MLFDFAGVGVGWHNGRADIQRVSYLVRVDGDRRAH